MAKATAHIDDRTHRRGSMVVRGLLALAVLLAVAYLVVCGVAAHIFTTPPRNFSPERTPATVGLDYQNVRFPTADNRVELAGWFIPSGGSRALVLVHGNTSSRTEEFGGQFIDFAAAMHARDFAILMFDLRGHGRSGDGRTGFGTNEGADVAGAVAWLVQAGFAPEQIGIFGLSMGGVASLAAAADNPAIPALVLDSTPAAVYPIIERQWSHSSGLPDFCLPGTLLMARVVFDIDIRSVTAEAAIQQVAPRPLLLIHGIDDELVPISNVDQLHAVATSAAVWHVPSAGHAQAYETTPRAYAERVGAFFDQHVSR